MANDQGIARIARIARHRSDGNKSIDGSDSDIEPDTIVIGSIPTTDVSDSDDAENEENDSSLGTFEIPLIFDAS